MFFYTSSLVLASLFTFTYTDLRNISVKAFARVYLYGLTVLFLLQSNCTLFYTRVVLRWLVTSPSTNESGVQFPLRVVCVNGFPDPWSQVFSGFRFPPAFKIRTSLAHSKTPLDRGELGRDAVIKWDGLIGSRAFMAARLDERT